MNSFQDSTLMASSAQLNLVYWFCNSLKPVPLQFALTLINTSSSGARNFGFLCLCSQGLCYNCTSYTTTIQATIHSYPIDCSAQQWSPATICTESIQYFLSYCYQYLITAKPVKAVWICFFLVHRGDVTSQAHQARLGHPSLLPAFGYHSRHCKSLPK